MMKSVFLSDSTMLDSTITGNSTSLNENDNDYIMVDNDCDSFVDGDEDYDYCDDIVSEVVQIDQHLNLMEEMILEEANEPSIQRILDEAHASAS